MTNTLTERIARNRLQEALNLIAPPIQSKGLSCIDRRQRANTGVDGWSRHAYLKLFSVNLLGIYKKYDVELWIDNYTSKMRFSIALSLNGSVVKKPVIKELITCCSKISEIDRELDFRTLYFEDYSNSESLSNERYVSLYCNDIINLPNQFNEFYERVLALVKEDKPTERVALIKERIGQDAFRNDLLEYWNNKCCVTGCDIAELLRASHIKPWSVCSNTERLSCNNGLLLIGTLDLAFDAGLITFSDDGNILIVKSEKVRLAKFGITDEMKINPRKISQEMNEFLEYHRNEVFNTGIE